MIQNVRTRTRISEILTFKDRDTEVVRSFKYLETAINNTNYETYEIKARIIVPNKAYPSLQSIFRSKQIHPNYKIRLYKTLIRSVLCYGSVTLTLTQMTE
jgi:hypothetical protein